MAWNKGSQVNDELKGFGRKQSWPNLRNLFYFQSFEINHEKPQPG
jgi:hypothetical protein